MNTKTAKTDDTADREGENSVRKKSKRESLLPAELTELVEELRETVRRIYPHKHTPKTLRRTLSTVNDIIADIDRITAPRT